MDAALTFLLGFVHAAARSAAEAAATRQDSAMSEEQWWAANAPLLTRVFDQTKYPTASRVGAAAAPLTARPMTPTTPTPLACSASSTASAP